MGKGLTFDSGGYNLKAGPGSVGGAAGGSWGCRGSGKGGEVCG